MDTMFCNQCEQTAGGRGCTRMGVCGKAPEPAALQDLLVYELKGLAYLAERCREANLGVDDAVVDVVVDGLFATLTNVNFDPDRIEAYIREAEAQKAGLSAQISLPQMPECAKYRAPVGQAAMAADAARLCREPMDKSGADDRSSLQTLLLLGLKGMAAYAHHARVLGVRDASVDAGMLKLTAALIDDRLGVPELLEMNLELGRVNLTCMEILDRANTQAYGNPEPTPVRVTRVKGPFIVVSGHDLKDLYDLLVQTQGTGVNVYTHGEMLPGHGYPKLKAFSNLVGNFGGAWQDQQKEFDNLPGAILMTTNCLQKPRESYTDRIYTTGTTGWPGIAHIEEKDGVKDFRPVIEAALRLGGFTEDEPEKTILTGFGHQYAIGVAPAIIDAVKTGAIRHFFLVGGCDGAKPGRNYYTDFARLAPKDTVILTLACGKYRFNKMDLGTVAGLPRLMDIGQCNDAYSAVRIALALADAFQCGVNDLPLTLILSWYEQKAVCILLTLLALGIKGIHIGPSLPAFLSPNIVKALVEGYALTPISGDAQADMDKILNKG